MKNKQTSKAKRNNSQINKIKIAIKFYKNLLHTLFSRYFIFCILKNSVLNSMYKICTRNIALTFKKKKTLEKFYYSFILLEQLFFRKKNCFLDIAITYK